MCAEKKYEAAEIVGHTLIDEVRVLSKLLLVILKSVFFSVPVFFSWIKEIIYPPNPKIVKGQLALVTGGSNGIGKAIALRLAQEGCNIAIANRNHEEGQRTAAEIQQKFGVNAKAFKVDVSNVNEVKKLRVDVENTLGTVDILVNNAASLALNISLLEGTSKDIQSIIDTNLTAYFWTVRQFLPGMIERKRGHVVSVSSLSAKVTMPNNLTYVTTKFGNDGFMKALFDDLCLNNHDDYINLTTVYPSFTATQKNLTSLLESITDIIAYDPDYVGDLIVKGMLANRREFIVPPSSALFILTRYFPDKVMKRAKLSLIDLNKRKQYDELRKNI
ncbi:CLUMA_CG019031, isoform A [Clunio marinus]|uniref:CLUMA_CG019031, isoform A n=1 Tax=Clunio marinus TaxID=568069 RepID=A0A1J1J1W9_9DIPT|nr:CLUMA_CG019031, isoform A [Clunio marinus]